MNYPGGKGGAGVYQKIINQIPPHDVYIEAFVGGGAVLLNKKPATCSIALDCDGDVVDYWNKNGKDLGVPGIIAEKRDAISHLPGLVQTEVMYGKRVFVYADPPYLGETRKGGEIYKHEMMDTASHTRLLSVLKKLPCMVAVSGYWSALYGAMLKDWRSIHFQAGTRGGVATEWLWMNYKQPTELHDYRYLGDNFRERERLKRIRTNWVNRLNKMDDLERLMLGAAIAESCDAGQHRT